MTITKITKEMIKKTVATSQKIEGYSAVDKETEKRVQDLKIKYNVKVSHKNQFL